ncbi:hypothetical protein ABBQ38_012746 [Trebouxia sp. C0009 RCD-2024]
MSSGSVNAHFQGRPAETQQEAQRVASMVQPAGMVRASGLYRLLCLTTLALKLALKLCAECHACPQAAMRSLHTCKVGQQRRSRRCRRWPARGCTLLANSCPLWIALTEAQQEVRRLGCKPLPQRRNTLLAIRNPATAPSEVMRQVDQIFHSLL